MIQSTNPHTKSYLTILGERKKDRKKNREKFSALKSYPIKFKSVKIKFNHGMTLLWLGRREFRVGYPGVISAALMQPTGPLISDMNKV